MNVWVPAPGEKMFFVTPFKGHHVQFVCRGDRFEILDDGDVEVRMTLRREPGTPSLEEHLAVAVLQKDEVAALALADDVREKFAEPIGFRSREELKAIIVGLKGEIERLDRANEALAEEKKRVGGSDYCPACRAKPCVCSRRWPMPTPKVTL